MTTHEIIKELENIGVKVDHLPERSKNRKLWKQLSIQIADTRKWVEKSEGWEIVERHQLLSMLAESPRQLKEDLTKSLDGSPDDSPCMNRILVTVEAKQLDAFLNRNRRQEMALSPLSPKGPPPNLGFEVSPKRNSYFRMSWTPKSKVGHIRKYSLP